MKPEEKELLLKAFNAADGKDHVVVNMYQIAAESGLPEKRAWYFIEKWNRKGFFEYGTSIGHCWMTPKGLEAVKKALDVEAEGK